MGRTWRWKFMGGPLPGFVAAREDPARNKAAQNMEVLRGKLHMMPLRKGWLITRVPATIMRRSLTPFSRALKTSVVDGGQCHRFRMKAIAIATRFIGFRHAIANLTLRSRPHRANRMGVNRTRASYAWVGFAASGFLAVISTAPRFPSK
jgi:hypothetical protein